MEKNRLEAFSDGVIAIIITIMVLELKSSLAHGADLAALKPLLMPFLSYVVSFVYVGIYWMNHHHMLHTIRRANGSILWANLHLLFWLSLMPFITAWVGEQHLAPMPMALYGVVLLMSAIAYWILQQSIICTHGRDSVLARAIGPDWKGKLSIVTYALGIIVATKLPYLSCALYVAIALVWLIPDRRIERALNQHEKQG